jgi:hypothetical protein
MTLQEMLAERARSDQRAMNAVVDARGNLVRILFGEVGKHSRIALRVEGDNVTIIGPKPTEAGEEAADGEDAGVRRPVNIDAGEFVDDRDPLHPGENPVDAAARIATEGTDQRQAEAVSDTTAVSTTTASQTGIGAEGGVPEGASEIKNPQPEGASTDGAGDAVQKINPEEHLKDELLKIAKDEGVTLAASDNTKAEIAAAINAKRGAK